MYIIYIIQFKIAVAEVKQTMMYKIVSDRIEKIDSNKKDRIGSLIQIWIVAGLMAIYKNAIGFQKVSKVTDYNNMVQLFTENAGQSHWSVVILSIVPVSLFTKRFDLSYFPDLWNIII